MFLIHRPIGNFWNMCYFNIDALSRFLYTWDNRKEENDFNTDYTFTNFHGGLFMKQISKHFYYDDNITIIWNGDKIFNVFRDEVLINSFEEQETLTPQKAELIADDWLAEKLQDKLRKLCEQGYCAYTND